MDVKVSFQIAQDSDMVVMTDENTGVEIASVSIHEFGGSIKTAMGYLVSTHANFY
jgi:hypothetical protein